MQTSPHMARLRERQRPVAPYRGSLTSTGGGEAAVLGPDWPPSQVLLYDTSWRTPIAVRGADARKWLNGMITANLRDLRVGRVVPSFQLDPKGHVLASFDVACIEEQSFRVLIGEDQRAALIERLKKFVFISKVEIEDEGEQYTSLRVRGPAWPEAWRRAGLAPLAGAEDCVQFPHLGADGAETAWAIGDSRGGVAQVEVWARPDELRGLWERLAPQCLTAGSATFERDRILSAVPRYGIDVTDAELPQETGQFDRLDFTKGCYVGQEIVERIRARGAVHRHLATISLAAAAAPGADLSVAGKVIGKLTSLTRRDGGWWGLGYVRDPHQAVGTVVRAGADEGGIEGRVEALLDTHDRASGSGAAAVPEAAPENARP